MSGGWLGTPESAGEAVEHVAGRSYLGNPVDRYTLVAALGEVAQRLGWHPTSAETGDSHATVSFAPGPRG